MDDVKEYGQIKMDDIQLICIIGEIEGHENLASGTKTTKYEHILPQLASMASDNKIKGILIMLNTVGGDVECGLAIAEMIASIGKPVVALVLGGSHSIGVPLAVSADYTFIVPTATMVVHPVRMNGLFIGARQTYEYFEKIQKRISSFVVGHSNITDQRYSELMFDTSVMTKDVGSILVGEQIIEEGLANEIGGLKEAINKLKELIENSL